jgi:hypothetical protein
MDLSDGGGLSYTIDNIDGTVNVYLMDSANFAEYSATGSADYINADYDVSWSSSYSAGSLPADTYYLVVENADSSTVTFDYQVDYGSDYSPSFWESILAGGLLSGTFCIIGLIGFIIWIYMLYWVYKDAKRRGKSGGLWLVITLFLGIIGLIIWLIVRPPLPPQQPYYQQPYQQQPYQQYPPQQPPQAAPQMPKRCPNCGMQVDPNWNTCPNCGTKLN